MGLATVEGGAVTGAARVDGESGVRAITVTPDTREALSISLPSASDREADGAVCTSDGRALSIGAAHIVTGPADQPMGTRRWSRTSAGWRTEGCGP